MPYFLYGIINNNRLNTLLKILNKNISLPQINRQLSLYSKIDWKELIIRLINRKAEFKIRELWKQDTSYTPFPIENIKDFLWYFNVCWFKKAVINEIIEIRYYSKKINIIIWLNTPVGHFIKISGQKEKDLLLTKKDIFKYCSFYTKPNFNKLINADTPFKSSEEKYIINKFGVLHPALKAYLDDLGINALQKGKCLKDKLDFIWNDFSFYEDIFYQITGQQLISEDSFSDEYITPSVSIIIPSYNSEATILKTLYSINSQNIKDYHNIEVIIIDDWSNISVDTIINKHRSFFKFSLLIIRFNDSHWRSFARNIWLSVAQFDNIICLDSAIIIPHNYIRENLSRITLIPYAIFMSFRKNINNKDFWLPKISNKLPPPEQYDDNRLERFVTPWQIWYYSIKKPTIVRVVSESNYFKKLWYGRTIGFYDLPLTISGHNMCFNKKYVNHGFCESFSWWGMEDAYFGAEAISKWVFIIPIISTWVYHIKHPPRSGSINIQKKELKKNLKLYKTLLSSP